METFPDIYSVLPGGVAVLFLFPCNYLFIQGIFISKIDGEISGSWKRRCLK